MDHIILSIRLTREYKKNHIDNKKRIPLLNWLLKVCKHFSIGLLMQTKRIK